jgi:hypothetical protein
LNGTVPLAAAGGFLFARDGSLLDLAQTGNKKRGCVVLDHTASNSSKALLGILTARGQEIYISD